MGRLRDAVDTFTGRGYTQQLERSSTYTFSDYLTNIAGYTFGGQGYVPALNTTWDPRKEEPIQAQYASIVQQAYRRNGIVFACVFARQLVFSEVEFKFQRLSTKELFGGPELLPLEKPGPNVTTVELLRRAEADISLAGNWYATNRFGGIKRLRPDWMCLIVGSDAAPDQASYAEDAEVVAYAYYPGGYDRKKDPVIFAPFEIAHWSPIPDPSANFLGMSWIEPAIREVMADNAGTDLRLRFYENGATPNLVITASDLIQDNDQMQDYLDMIDRSHGGAHNAFKTLMLYAGSTAERVGLGLSELDMKGLQGAGETRIAAASRVPPVYLAISEGLSGSSLNQGNYGMARRQFADGFLRPQWRDFCACISSLVKVPDGCRLWRDETEVAFLREDEKDAAEIFELQAQAIRTLTDGGYEPETVIAATKAKDPALLKHTGMVSVQMQEPGAEMEKPSGNGSKPMPEMMPSPTGGQETTDE